MTGYGHSINGVGRKRLSYRVAPIRNMLFNSYRAQSLHLRKNEIFF